MAFSHNDIDNMLLVALAQNGVSTLGPKCHPWLVRAWHKCAHNISAITILELLIHMSFMSYNKLEPSILWLIYVLRSMCKWVLILWMERLLRDNNLMIVVPRYIAYPLHLKYKIRKKELNNVAWNYMHDLRSQNKI